MRHAVERMELGPAEKMSGRIRGWSIHVYTLRGEDMSQTAVKTSGSACHQ